MNDYAKLSAVDYVVFVVYMLATLALGFAAGRKARGRPKDYFLGEKKLPWYVVGTSMVASDISSEHFIAHVGIAYQYGMVVATQSWNAWIIYSIFLFVFLPYYVRTGLYTMPQFLEQRYNSTCRYLFAISLVIGYIFTLLAGSLYAGGLTIEQIFGLSVSADLSTNIKWGVVFFAATTGAYTIYGGMKSSAWTDFMQMLVLLFAGLLLPILALYRTHGLFHLANEMPEKFDMFLPATHVRFPWSGVYTGFLTVGLWYTCASQHIVQRVLSAKDEWHARMGVVSAGFLRIITPLFFVIPGIAAAKLFPKLEVADHAYLMLVKTLIPTGLKGLILAGMAAALMSTVSTVLNSTSTLLTIDIYKKLLRPNAGDREQVLFGMIVGVVVLVLSVYIAFLYSDALTRATPAAATAAQAAESAATTKVLTPKPETHGPESLFVVVQQVFFYIAPPFAVVFLLGLLWRRANATAAVVTIVGGFMFLWLLQNGIYLKIPHVATIDLYPPLWDAIPWLTPYKRAYQHSALISWIFCVLLMVVTSLLTAPPPAEKVDRIIWNRSYLNLPVGERQRYRGWKNFILWWFVFIAIVLSIYGFFLWFSLSHGQIAVKP